jgi:hypothetical protein
MNVIAISHPRLRSLKILGGHVLPCKCDDWSVPER